MVFPDGCTRRALIGLLVVLAAIGPGGCGESSTKRQAEKQAAERRERANLAEQRQRAIVVELASPHQAVTLPADHQSFAWTADVQDALMPEGGQPVAGVASISDVERDGKSHIVRLIHGDFLRASIVLMLRCERPAEGTEDHLFTGDRMRTFAGPRYAFVAKIDVVRAIRGVVPDQSGPDVHRVGWLAEGKCLALRRMPVEEKPTLPSRRAP
jgi:hypothetical protein